MFLDPTFWVGVGTIIFLISLTYLGIHKIIIKKLDNHANFIKNELNEARCLKEKAQCLLAEYERKQKDAEEKSKLIIEKSLVESKKIKSESENKFDNFVNYQMKITKNKIFQAKLQAYKKIQFYAVDIAILATKKIIINDFNKSKASALIDKSIILLKDHLK